MSISWIGCFSKLDHSNAHSGRCTTIARPIEDPLCSEAGGLSGAPVRSASTAIIRRAFQRSAGKLPIIGVGGIASAEDAWEKIQAGASLVQIYTGFIYEGPPLVRALLTGLSTRLESAGLRNIEAAVGSAAQP